MRLTNSTRADESSVNASSFFYKTCLGHEIRFFAFTTTISRKSNTLNVHLNSFSNFNQKAIKISTLLLMSQVQHARNSLHNAPSLVKKLLWCFAITLSTEVCSSTDFCCVYFYPRQQAIKLWLWKKIFSFIIATRPQITSEIFSHNFVNQLYSTHKLLNFSCEYFPHWREWKKFSFIFNLLTKTVSRTEENFTQSYNIRLKSFLWKSSFGFVVV